jgi:carboxylesterase
MLEYIIGIFALLSVYREINFFLIKRRTKGPAKIMKDAESFFIKKGKKAVILIHGFTSSPKEFEELSSLLSKNNITCYALLLPGHGTSPERLAVTKYYQWIESVNESINSLSKNYNEIYLIGNSMGANLALISANQSRKIKGIITLGAPIFFPKEKIHRYVIIPILKRIKLFQKKMRKKEVTRLDNSRAHYDCIPLMSLKHMLKIVSLSKENLKNIFSPILVMQTKEDKVIKEDSAEYILKNVKSKDKKLILIPKSYHVFIIDKYKDKANKHILNFIKKGGNK